MDPGGQSYVERPPVTPLMGLVSTTWIQEVGPDAEPYRQRSVPSGGVELLCTVGEAPRLVGPLTHAQVVVLEPGTRVLGLRFHPGAAAASERTIRRRMNDAVGLAPKPLHRILRFQGFLALAQHAIAQGRVATDDGLALLAAEAGYADQPHLNRECQRLTGESPGAFLRQTQHTCACGHDHSASFAPVLQARPRA